MNKIWIVIPTYNEAENITEIIPAILAVHPQFHVLVADDNSPDGTAALAERIGNAQPDRIGRVQILRRSGKQGYGKAVFAGFRRALELGADQIFSMDCDWSHDPSALPALLAQLERTDVAIGSRYIRGGRTVHWPVSRKILSATANTLARSIVGLPVRDCTGGFRGYRREVIERLVQQSVQSATYTFLVETLFHVRRLGFSIGEVPITFRERQYGQSKVTKKLIVDSAINLAKIGWRRLRREAPVR